ncbi:hypothetical protein QIW31_01175 [Francisellaceae bacterium CB299]|jgi:hypothetical protein
MLIRDMGLVLVHIQVRWLSAVVLAKSIVLYMKMGMTVKEAAKDLRHLKTGYLDELTIHAIDSQDNCFVASFKGSEPVYYWVLSDGMDKPVKKQAEVVF